MWLCLTTHITEKNHNNDKYRDLHLAHLIITDLQRQTFCNANRQKAENLMSFLCPDSMLVWDIYTYSDNYPLRSLSSNIPNKCIKELMHINNYIGLGLHSVHTKASLSIRRAVGLKNASVLDHIFVFKPLCLLGVSQI